jgi:hypothetical protein
MFLGVQKKKVENSKSALNFFSYLAADFGDEPLQ